MKELHFEYRMRLDFDPPIEQHHFTLKCIPRSDARQKITDLTINVTPKEFLSEDEDSFGNRCFFGSISGKQDFFEVRVEGNAICGLADYEESGEEEKIAKYRYQTDRTRPGPSIFSLYRRIPVVDTMTDFEKARAFMEGLSHSFSYVPQVTDVSTTAEEAFAGGKGVCQDYTHILLSLCRIERIPCRYVTGMLSGEGASHAWVEVLDQGKWKGLDPTNEVVVADDHIRIASGRDCRDCRMNHGRFVGNTRQCQTVVCLVQEKGEQNRT